MPLDAEKQRILKEGHYFLAIERFEKALERYNQLLAYQPNNGMFLFYRARCLYWLKRNDEALQACMQALENGYQEDECNYLLGKIFTYGMKRYVEAENCFIEALRISPQRADIIASYGNLMHRIGDHNKALALFDKSLAIEPDNIYALHHKFYVTYFLGDYSELPALLERYMQTSASEADKLKKAYIVEISKHNNTAAIENLKQALLLDPTDKAVLRRLHNLETHIDKAYDENGNSKVKIFNKHKSISAEKQSSKLELFFRKIKSSTGSPPKE